MRNSVYIILFWEKICVRENYMEINLFFIEELFSYINGFFKIENYFFT